MVQEGRFSRTKKSGNQCDGNLVGRWWWRVLLLLRCHQHCRIWIILLFHVHGMNTVSISNSEQVILCPHCISVVHSLCRNLNRTAKTPTQKGLSSQNGQRIGQYLSLGTNYVYLCVLKIVFLLKGALAFFFFIIIEFEDFVIFVFYL